MTEKGKEVAVGELMTGWIDTNAITRITTKMHRISWTIENISKVPSGKKIPGPEFHFTPTEFAGVSFQKEDDLYVYVTNKSDTEIQIERKLILLDCNDKKLHEENGENIFRLIKGEDKDIIGSVKDRQRFNSLPNDTLIIYLSLSIRGEITTETHRNRFIINPRQKLIEDLKTMQKNSVNSDLSLQVGNERISAHWSILCSRSPYFKNMFDSEMSERVQNSITVTDVSLGTLKKLIEFLYTADFVEDDNDDLEELFGLYYAADKYEVMDMRALSRSKIMSKATSENVCQIFQLALRHSDKNLKTEALDFIQFHWNAVSQTDGWKEFEVSEPLAAELFSFGLKKK